MFQIRNLRPPLTWVNQNELMLITFRLCNIKQEISRFTILISRAESTIYMD
jgi:hypothetical protein